MSAPAHLAHPPAGSPGRESRQDARVVCQGHVRLSTDSGEVGAELVDVSARGFRARHNDPGLLPGTMVRFEHRFFVGSARVMWTELLAGRPHSGFQIVAAQ